jgi:hypothetical protein
MSDPSPSTPVPDFRSRDHFQRARFRALDPAQRLAAMQRLIDAAWAVLERHPEGLAHFRRRNFQARAVRRSPEVRADGT